MRRSGWSRRKKLEHSNWAKTGESSLARAARRIEVEPDHRDWTSWPKPAGAIVVPEPELPETVKAEQLAGLQEKKARLDTTIKKLLSQRVAVTKEIAALERG